MSVAGGKSAFFIEGFMDRVGNWYLRRRCSTATPQGGTLKDSRPAAGIDELVTLGPDYGNQNKSPLNT